MDLKEYISSGILESYATGIATAQERQEVECLSSIYPEIREELELISNALEKYAQAHAVKPSSDLKNKIMAQIEMLDGQKDAEPLKETATTIPLPNREHKTKTVNFKSYFSYSVAASLAIIAIMGLSIFRLQDQLSTSEEKIARLESESNEVRLALSNVSELKTKQASLLNMMKDPNNMEVSMKGLPAKDERASAQVLWNKESKEVYLTIDMLPAPPTDMQYQLWAIIDGQPTDAGVFNMDDELYHKMKDITRDPQAFAVTLEKMGGSVVPDLNQMYVMGTL